MSPRIFWCFVSNSAFFKWQMSISEAKWTFAPFVLASSITFFLTSDFHQVPRRSLFQFFPFLVNCCLCCRNFHGLAHRKKFVFQFFCCSELSPFPAIWSSWWFGKESPIRSLVDSLASKINASLDLISLDLPQVTTCWLFLLVLQGMAGATGVSNFLRAFLMVSLNSLSSGSMK